MGLDHHDWGPTPDTSDAMFPSAAEGSHQRQHRVLRDTVAPAKDSTATLDVSSHTQEHKGTASVSVHDAAADHREKQERLLSLSNDLAQRRQDLLISRSQLSNEASQYQHKRRHVHAALLDATRAPYSGQTRQLRMPESLDSQLREDWDALIKQEEKLLKVESSVTNQEYHLIDLEHRWMRAAQALMSTSAGNFKSILKALSESPDCKPDEAVCARSGPEDIPSPARMYFDCVAERKLLEEEHSEVLVQWQALQVQRTHSQDQGMELPEIDTQAFSGLVEVDAMLVEKLDRIGKRVQIWKNASLDLGLDLEALRHRGEDNEHRAPLHAAKASAQMDVVASYQPSPDQILGSSILSGVSKATQQRGQQVDVERWLTSVNGTSPPDSVPFSAEVSSRELSNVAVACHLPKQWRFASADGTMSPIHLSSKQHSLRRTRSDSAFQSSDRAVPTG